MRYPFPLEKGVLQNRTNRFVATIQLNNGLYIEAYCPNTGRLTGLSDPGTTVWVQPKPIRNTWQHTSELYTQSSGEQDRPHHLPYVWELVEKDGLMIGINTHIANILLDEAFENQAPLFKTYSEHMTFMER